MIRTLQSLFGVTLFVGGVLAVFGLFVMTAAILTREPITVEIWRQVFISVAMVIVGFAGSLFTGGLAVNRGLMVP